MRLLKYTLTNDGPDPCLSLHDRFSYCFSICGSSWKHVKVLIKHFILVERNSRSFLLFLIWLTFNNSQRVYDTCSVGLLALLWCCVLSLFCSEDRLSPFSDVIVCILFFWLLSRPKLSLLICRTFLWNSFNDLPLTWLSLQFCINILKNLIRHFPYINAAIYGGSYQKTMTLWKSDASCYISTWESDQSGLLLPIDKSHVSLTATGSNDETASFIHFESNKVLWNVVIKGSFWRGPIFWGFELRNLNFVFKT